MCGLLHSNEILVFLADIVNAHRSMGDRPRADGRSLMGRWVIAHGAVGADYLREKIGKLGFGNEYYRILPGKVR